MVDTARSTGLGLNGSGVGINKTELQQNRKRAMLDNQITKAPPPTPDQPTPCPCCLPYSSLPLVERRVFLSAVRFFCCSRVVPSCSEGPGFKISRDGDRNSGIPTCRLRLQPPIFLISSPLFRLLLQRNGFDLLATALI